MTAHTGFAVSPTGAGAGTTPQGARLGVGGLLARSGGAPLAFRRGILYDGGGPVVSGTSGMEHQVRANVAVLGPSFTQGPVLLPTSAAVNVPTSAAPGSNSRIDVIWLRQRLTSADGGADTTVAAEWGVTSGAASSSPTAPSIPSGALEVARAVVTAGVSSTAGLTYTQTHLWTAAAGAPIPVRSDAERNALVGYDGLLVNHLAWDRLERHNGSSWLPLGVVPWDTYVPNWQAGSSTPTVGNGSMTGEWRDTGGLIEFVIRLQIGSSTAIPGGPWTFSLPATPATGRWSITGTATDVSNGNFYGVQSVIEAGGRLGVRTLASGPLPPVGASSPFTWAVNDSLIVHGSYRAA